MFEETFFASPSLHLSLPILSLSLRLSPADFVQNKDLREEGRGADSVPMRKQCQCEHESRLWE